MKAGVAVFACIGLLSVLSPAVRADGELDTLVPVAAASPGDDDTNNSNSGPVRLARIAYLNGDVTWRTDAQSDWSPAARNMPLRQGAQVSVADGGRAEIQFDDGSRVRLDANTLITLQTLYSDADGEFTEITLNEGEVFLRLTNQYSLYQVNTPEASLKAAGPARLRVGGGDGAQFAVRLGKATIDGTVGKVTLQQGDYLDVVDNTTPYKVGPLPQPDAWDVWNDTRDTQLDAPTQSQAHLPPNIALVAGNLDTYGSWHNDPTYGWIWVPNVTDAQWRPYSAGRWTWVEPFGWTWVADEPWGWAPYHYGTWTSTAYGWAWVPGPATQYWSPAVVSFYDAGTRVAWCPLAPREVVYPATLAVGFRSANWSLFFSIGGAAVYYPGPEHVVIARPWPSVYVNHVTYVTNVVNITVNHNTYVTTAFVPANARFHGGTEVEVSAFVAGRAAAYRPVAGADLTVFTSGHAIGAPVGGSPVAGPQSVHVTAQALTPTRTFVPATAMQRELASRPVYRAALPARVPASVATPQQGQRFITRTNGGNGASGNRTGTSSGSSGRPSALEEYLRDRAAASGHSSDTSGSGSGRNSSTQPGSGSSGRDNTREESGGTTSRSNSSSAGTTSRSNSSSAGTTSRSNSSTSRTSSYRPLHTRSTSGSRDSGSHSGGKSGDEGKNNDRGH